MAKTDSVHWTLAVVALSILAVATVSARLHGTSLTPAMVFVAIGVVAGPLVLDEIHVSSGSESVKVLAEATLTLVLFADASRIRLRELRRELGVPLRLLGIGLPLTIAAGALGASLVFGDFSLSAALVLAVLLAPTDAALGQAVVTEPRLPSRIRQSLNVESGLNDGICVPILLIVLAAADVNAATTTSHHAIKVLTEQLAYGVLAGIAAGALAGCLVRTAGGNGLMTSSWAPVVPVAGAGLAYGIATPLGGSGFIAAFVAGIAFGIVLGRDPGPLASLSEELGQLLNGVTFLAFGAVMLGPALEHVSWQVAVYSVLSLTVLRMLPVALAMLGTRARAPTVAFVGWFGPRGLASIVFAVLVLDEADLPETGTILEATFVTIGLSVLLHGLSASPLAGRYADWFASHPRDAAPVMESRPAPEPRVRGPLAASRLRR